MKTKYLLYIVVVLPILMVSCKNNKNTEYVDSLSQSEITENLVDANKAALRAEDLQIENLIIRDNLNMKKSATGLRYFIRSNGKGQLAKIGQYAKIKYTVSLLNGQQVYTSETLGAKEFRIGSGGVESGLEEGILLMRVGDESKFIIPSYLAHGLAGDQDKIPAKSTLIYTVELLELN